MKKVALTLVSDFEIVEAMAPLDMLRRAGIYVDVISVENKDYVKSAINIEIKVDKKLKDVDLSTYDLVILPGGPGTKNYYDHQDLLDKVKANYNNKKMVSAICAGPSVLANLGILEGRNAISFPSFQHVLVENNAKLVNEQVVVSDNVITGRAAAASIEFGLKLVEMLEGKETREKVEKAIVY
ncbi:DJ-1/PfpI family protein [Sneathia sp. DSM 16630]|uniref:DJ-1 family glyoxalase III n=1 Tax=Sneathia vaginalis TaxID=187101 RepID=UPI00288948E2|nr:DJ-1 family glyoxalase III [Sneathia vaginalis]MBE2989699.1 DJ-1/PfpI family protein [Sneathia sp. DSM 16630]